MEGWAELVVNQLTQKLLIKLRENCKNRPCGLVKLHVSSLLFINCKNGPDLALFHSLLVLRHCKNRPCGLAKLHVSSLWLQGRRTKSEWNSAKSGPFLQLMNSKDETCNLAKPQGRFLQFSLNSLFFMYLKSDIV